VADHSDLMCENRGTGDVEFSEKYEISAERAGRKAVIGMKNSARPQSLSKRRKLIRL
jgi:hypothetical protein